MRRLTLSLVALAAFVTSGVVTAQQPRTRLQMVPADERPRLAPATTTAGPIPLQQLPPSRQPAGFVADRRPAVFSTDRRPAGFSTDRRPVTIFYNGAFYQRVDSSSTAGSGQLMRVGNYRPNSSFLPASYMMRPTTAVPSGYQYGRGLIGQPKLYVPGQPVRNMLRFITP